MILKSYIKAPGTRQDYGIDWKDDLAPGETIVSSSWTITPAGLTLLTTHVFGTQAVFWADGGAPGVGYTAENTITTSRTNPQTAQPRVVVKSIGILVRAR